MNLNHNMLNLRILIKKGKVKPAYIILPLIFSLFAVFFDGIGKSLLVPLMNGVIKADFSFVCEPHLFGLISRVFPNISASSNVSFFVVLLTMIFMAEFVSNIFGFFASIVTAYHIRIFTNNIRKLLFERCLNFGKTFFDKNSFGYINNIIITEVDYIGNSLIGLQEGIVEILRLFIYMAILLFISWKLTFFVLIVFPVLHYSVKWLIMKVDRTSMDFSVFLDKLNRKVFNTLTNIALVKFYNTEKKEKENFSSISDIRTMLEFSIDKKWKLVQRIQSIFILLSISVFILAMSFVSKDRFFRDISKFLVYFYILRIFINTVGSLNILRGSVSALTGHLNAILIFFDDKEKYFVLDGKAEFKGFRKEIDIRHLTFSYDKKKSVLNDISFSIKRGETFAIVGPTGSGKTTIVNLLMRFYDCPPGTIFIDGIDIREFSFGSLRNSMAFVSQDTLLFDDTIKNNILYGLGDVSNDELDNALKKAKLYDFVISLPNKYETLIGDKGVRLSGGERQRVSIARALLKKSEILILDEATSSLDVMTERLIQDGIEEVMKNKTAIVIAHRFFTLKNSNRIVVIEHGRVMEEGTLNELLDKKGRFYQYWEGQKFY